MFDVGGGELILIILAIIVLFGPKKIPEIAQMIGKGIRKFNQAKSEFESEINNIKNDINSSSDLSDLNLPLSPNSSVKVEKLSPDALQNELFSDYENVHSETQKSELNIEQTPKPTEITSKKHPTDINSPDNNINQKVKND